MDKKRATLGIDLSPEEKKKLLEEIVYYFETERDEKLGIIASEGILDFFLEDLGIFIYNKALEDAKKWYGKRMEDVEADYYTLFKEEH
ncbi:MAG TPA: DUF2164 domain-containing protein [Lachnospiraceae bacterium]|jgi:uncharacterized protein (DUF2164 family)|nr:DUF2164 domain-containing protein [Lachnospiraceae bacterium]